MTLNGRFTLNFHYYEKRFQELFYILIVDPIYRSMLLLGRYVPGVARGVHEINIYIEDRPTTDLAFWKISNGHITATGHPIHFMFGSRVGFSRSADQMALLPVGPNPRWRLAAILENFE